MKNAKVECLSRLPNTPQKGSLLENNAYLAELYHPSVKCEEVAGELSRDKFLCKIIEYTQFGWPENIKDNKV